jgi:hypothetical protein
VTSLISAFLSFVIASPFIFLRSFPPLVGSTALLSVFLPIGGQADIPLLCRCFGGYDYSGSETPDSLFAQELVNSCLELCLWGLPLNGEAFKTRYVHISAGDSGQKIWPVCDLDVKALGIS